jgi:hypothetical protein
MDANPRDKRVPLIQDLPKERPGTEIFSPLKNSSNLKLRYHFSENPATIRTESGINRFR